MPSLCQDDSHIKSGRLTVDNPLYVHKHSNRSAPNLLTDQALAPESVPPTHGLLQHFLPRHAYFRAHLKIHQISNIPLVSGRFSVRWKFKNVHSPPRTKYGIFGLGKGRSRPNTPMVPIESLVSDKRNDSTGSETNIDDYPVPSVVISSSSDYASTSMARPAKPTPLVTAQSTARDAASRGQTAIVDLKDYSVMWHHSVTTVLRLDVSRDSGMLAPSQLKLVVVQHPVRNDPESVPQNPRLGALYLNMAEYVDKGAVQRKYLLKESKINAILTLTVELECIGGSTSYKAPPLPKGEILNGITSLLERDFYYAEKNTPYGKETFPYPRQVSQSSTHSDMSLDSRRSDSPSAPFNVALLPGADGARNTQALIDALFNPLTTTEKVKQSPFTVYVSSEGQDNTHVQNPLHAMPKRNRQNPEAASMYSTGSSSEDAWTTARTVSSTSSVAPSVASSRKSSKVQHLQLSLAPYGVEIEPAQTSARSIKGWFKKRPGSRPSTPTTVT
ncbi:N-terminal C2 in EEIG1 and EHBP1 proteins domain containing protein [Amanita muscaria]